LNTTNKSDKIKINCFPSNIGFSIKIDGIHQVFRELFLLEKALLKGKGSRTRVKMRAINVKTKGKMHQASNANLALPKFSRATGHIPAVFWFL
jgi:hypothetical protein